MLTYTRQQTPRCGSEGRLRNRPLSARYPCLAEGCIAGPRIDHAQEAAAIDVEYAHVLLSDGSHTSVAAWVCVVVPYHPRPLLNTYCRHCIFDSVAGQPSEHSTGRASPLRTIGGVRMASLHGAPSLSDVAYQVLALTEGRLLVGHGLKKDMHALGLEKQMQQLQCYDTMSFGPFQGKQGSSRSLRKLAKDFLGLDIQGAGQAHDPEVDARIALQLYMEHVRPKLLGSYDDLVAHYAQQFLANAQQMQADVQEDTMDTSPLEP